MDPSRDHLNRKLRTITHLALYRRTLRLVCANQSCGHYRLLDPIPLWWMFSRLGWDDRLGRALGKFYCSKCWRAHRWVLRPRGFISEEPPTGAQFAYPPESEWKRLIRRYRS